MVFFSQEIRNNTILMAIQNNQAENNTLKNSKPTETITYLGQEYSLIALASYFGAKDVLKNLIGKLEDGKDHSELLGTALKIANKRQNKEIVQELSSHVKSPENSLTNAELADQFKSQCTII